ncbi:MAG: hypothetical protein V5A21_03460 [Halapricum sp.]
MYLGIDVHKRYAQVAVMDEAGEIVEEVRVDRRPSEAGRGPPRATAIARQRPHRITMGTAYRLGKQQIPRRHNYFVENGGLYR